MGSVAISFRVIKHFHSNVKVAYTFDKVHSSRGFNLAKFSNPSPAPALHLNEGARRVGTRRTHTSKSN